MEPVVNSVDSEYSIGTPTTPSPSSVDGDDVISNLVDRFVVGLRFFIGCFLSILGINVNRSASSSIPSDPVSSDSVATEESFIEDSDSSDSDIIEVVVSQDCSDVSSPEFEFKDKFIDDGLGSFYQAVVTVDGSEDIVHFNYLSELEAYLDARSPPV